MPRLSIVIPTHHRPEILKLCLRHISKQTIVEDIEVIIVHDGEDDETTRVMLSSTKHDRFSSFHYFSVPKSQQGVARNAGVKKAKGEYIMFIGDDILLESDACEVHMNVHEQNHHCAVLGFTTWDPAVGITPVMEWLEKSSWQFGYPLIKNYTHRYIPSHMQHRFTYTSHISLPTKMAKKVPFVSDITEYGWEDVVWGKALKEAGVPLLYEPHAKALHHHKVTLEQSLKRMETLGRTARRMKELDPDFPQFPTGWKYWAYHVAALMPDMMGKHRKAFLRGLRAK